MRAAIVTDSLGQIAVSPPTDLIAIIPVIVTARSALPAVPLMLALMLATKQVVTIFVLVPQVPMESLVSPTANSMVVNLVMRFVQVLMTVLVPIVQIIVLAIVAIITPIGIVPISGVVIAVAPGPNAD